MFCRKCETCLKEDCQYDAFVVIKDGQLTHGAIDEAAYGSFSGKILDTIVKEYGPSRAKEFLDRSTDLAICGIMKTGITTGTNDEEIPEEAITMRKFQKRQLRLLMLTWIRLNKK